MPAQVRLAVFIAISILVMTFIRSQEVSRVYALYDVQTVSGDETRGVGPRVSRFVSDLLVLPNVFPRRNGGRCIK